MNRYLDSDQLRNLNSQLDAAHAENHRLIVAARDLNERIDIQANANIQHQKVEVDLQNRIQELQSQLVCATATSSIQPAYQHFQALEKSLAQYAERLTQVQQTQAQDKAQWQ